MSENMFDHAWVVMFRFSRDEKWRITPSTLYSTRREAIENYEDEMYRAWRGQYRRGLVRCIKVRIVPVEGASDE